MNYFDDSIIYFLNGYSRVLPEFDFLMSLLIRNHFLKGGILMTILWFLWFQDKSRVQAVQNNDDKKIKQGKQQIQQNQPNQQEKQLLRERIILTLCSGFIAIILGRFLAYILPFRLRPLQNLLLHFKVPYGISPDTLNSWSSFPSDHAVLFFALATGIFIISRKIGILTAIYILLVICFPRLYCGLHYMTDIIAGAVIGIGIGWFVLSAKINKYIAMPAMYWLNRSPGSFYACFFLLTFLLADMFDSVMELGIYLKILLFFKPV